MTQSHDAEKKIAAELRLRGEPPRVMRLSRRTLVVLGSGAAIAIAAAAAFAVHERPGRAAEPELVATNTKPPTDGLGSLPQDYASLPRDVPRLGPPLPGDLGRPILNAQGGAPGAAEPSAPGDAAQRLRDQERQAARTSRLFVADTRAAVPQAPDGFDGPAAGTPAATSLAAGGRKPSYLAAATDLSTTSPHRIEAPASPYVLQAGSIVPAALLTGIRSDLPGQVTAQVTENVYDSPTGRILLIPQGARLLGAYDSQVEFGQSRVLLAWTRLILPGGRSIVLDRQPAGDAQGFAGLQDGVDRHWKQLASAAVLSAILGVGAELGQGPDDSDVAKAVRQGGANAANQAGQQVVAKTLDVQPTLTVRPGFPVRVLVTRDLVLEPLGS